MAVSFIGRGNQSTRRKPPTCRKSLSSFKDNPIHKPGANRIGGVMVSVLASGAVDCGLESRSGQTKDYKIGIAASPLSTQL
jgi:hypothetical protein